jgi:hypothetical protein
MNGWDSGTARKAFQPQIEVRRVDTDKNVRWVRQQTLLYLAVESPQPWQMADNLEDPHDSQLLHIAPGLAARSPHFCTGYALKLSVGVALAEGMNKPAGQLIARCFARYDDKSRHGYRCR